ncbi:MAG: sulfotransferase [Xenococcaceae cyanobacterium]
MQQILKKISKLNFINHNNIDYLKTYYQSLKAKNNFTKINQYCIFIGYQRSGSSLVGSLLDAHPNVVIAHELNAMKFFEAKYSKNQIYYLLLKNSQEFARQGRSWSGYSYEVPNQWQGKFSNLQIIGDKKAALSTIKLGQNLQLLQQIRQTLQLPIKFVHVYRNPYDNITTMFKKKDRKSTKLLDFEGTIDYYFELCETINTLKKNIDPQDIFELKHEFLIDNPQKALHELCNFLEIEANKDYLNDCASIVFKSPRKTRETIEWDEAQIELVKSKMAKFDFLQGYCY